nr:protein kinase [Streptomyces cupreus]
MKSRTCRPHKPANLLVTDDGTTKIVDFGIAHLTYWASPDEGAPALGTAAYVAPEFALHHPAGPAADLYALGCVLCELLAGRHRFLAPMPLRCSTARSTEPRPG